MLQCGRTPELRRARFLAYTVWRHRQPIDILIIARSAHRGVAACSARQRRTHRQLELYTHHLIIVSQLPSLMRICANI